MAFSYVIEHMEEDEDSQKSIPRWVELEYMNMRTLAGPGATLHFTHLSPASCSTLSTLFAQNGDSSTVLFEEDKNLPRMQACAHTKSVTQLMEEKGVPIERVCLLDPKAEKELSPEDGDGRFEWFLFGGILGDDPPRDRTGELRELGFPGRRLGPVQMTTDTALGVTKLVAQDQKPLEKIPYIDFPTIVFNPKESVEMPFRYISDGKGPILPPGMREHLREDLNQSFVF